MNHKWIQLSIILMLGILLCSNLFAGKEWYKSYEKGLDAMEKGEYEAAATFFREAIKGNPKDNEKIRTYGMHFIEYYPHRELGICYYKLVDYDKAKKELKISIIQSPTSVAAAYLSNIEGRKKPLSPKKADEKKRNSN